MSLTMTCDLCGREIEDSDQYVTLGTSSSRTVEEKLYGGERNIVGGWVGHYHCDTEDEKDCYWRFDEMLELVRSHGDTLSRIPVAEPTQPRRPEPARLLEERRAIGRTLHGAGLPPRALYALVSAGIDLDAARRLSDEDLLAVDGVGPVALRRLRDAQRGKCR